MHKVSITGETRYGEFELSEGQVNRTVLDVENIEGTCNGDVLEVAIHDSDSPSNLKEMWMVLWGTPVEVVRAIDLVFPMAKMETDAIFDQLDQEEDEARIFYAYPLSEPESLIIRNSLIHKTLRSSQRALVASLFEMDIEKVTLIDLKR